MAESVALPHLRPEIQEAIEAAGDPADLAEVVRIDPLCLPAWAGLGDGAYAASDEVAAYAYYRVGYHRGLDLLRSAGWRPDVEVHHSEGGNAGFLDCLYGLMRAAAAIGEGVEARRCREFCIQLDPSDPYGVGAIKPKDLSRRLEEGP